MPINLFLLGCEVFGEFYTGTLHADSAPLFVFWTSCHKRVAQIHLDGDFFEYCVNRGVSDAAAAQERSHILRGLRVYSHWRVD